MDPTIQREIESFARIYRLRLPDRQRASLAGDLAGKRTGSSIEYQDRKDYVPGDDIRHVDWRAFARNDRLTIKLYREEISPRVDIIADTSNSMGSSDEKSLMLGHIVFFFALLAQKVHATVHLYNLGSDLAPIRHALDIEQMERSRQDSPLPLLHRAPFVRRGGIKILLSDFLFPFEPRELRSIFSGADHLIMVQLLSKFEANPEAGGEWRLQDAETGDFLDVSLNRETVSGYKERLEHLQEDMSRQMQMAQGGFAVATESDSLSACMRRFLHAGIIET
ncbi:MAG: DUF58 domain-containing protein [Candidatus Sumerlaeia bacterium]